MSETLAAANKHATAPGPVRRSYSAQMLREVYLKLGARIGLAWIGLLVLVAVFAPFLANSHPLLVSEDGNLHSPLLLALTAGDVSLLVIFISALILSLLRVAFRYKALIFTLLALTVTLVSYFMISPPQLTIYEQYREAEAAGRYDWVLRTPIPYSPKDYQRDAGETGLQAPLSDPARPHLMGTDENGADVLSRMIHASRIALGIGFVATGIALVIGVFIGGLMGYFSGVVDMIGMRLVETFEAVPTLFCCSPSSPSSAPIST